jgi:hypothetical protein
MNVAGRRHCTVSHAAARPRHSGPRAARPRDAQLRDSAARSAGQVAASGAGAAGPVATSRTNAASGAGAAGPVAASGTDAAGPRPPTVWDCGSEPLPTAGRAGTAARGSGPGRETGARLASLDEGASHKARAVRRRPSFLACLATRPCVRASANSARTRSLSVRRGCHSVVDAARRAAESRVPAGVAQRLVSGASKEQYGRGMCRLPPVGASSHSRGRTPPRPAPRRAVSDTVRSGDSGVHVLCEAAALGQA